MKKILDFINKEGAIVINQDNKFLDKLINIEKYRQINIFKTKAINYKNFINDNSSLEGNHNHVNASIAISLAKKLNVNEEKIKLSITNYISC